MGRATARAPMEKPAAALKAPLFRLALEQLEDGERRVVLDLGAASSELLSLLGGFRCRVEIADFARDGGIERLNAAEPDALSAAAESTLPPHRPGEDLDLVFLWDLLNYLKPAAAAALAAAIARRARPGARAHALIVYSERSMPDRPGRFLPNDDYTLANRAAAGAEVAAPRYSPELLEQIMRGFSIEHARLLANGMQEFLFQLRQP